MSSAQAVSMKKIIRALASTSGTMANFAAAESAAVTIISPSRRSPMVNTRGAYREALPAAFDVIVAPGRRCYMRVGLAISLVAVLAGAAARAEGPAAPADHTAMAPDQIKWGDVPPIFAKGAKMAVLFGDPSKDGLFIVRLKMPANYKVMPHWHPTDENVTVLSGSFAIGMGDKLDPKTKALGAGAFVSLPAKMHHYAFTTKDTVVEVSAMGPFALTYVNPEDDPSKAAASK